MKFFLTALLVIFAWEKEAYAQNSTFEWWTESCTCKGIFDPDQYSVEQLQNTLDLLYHGGSIFTDAIAFRIGEEKYLSLDTLNKECSTKLDQLKTWNFVDNPFWRKVKETKIRYIESICKLKRVTILAHKDPTILNDYPYAEDTCNFFVNALIEGGQNMRDAWILLNEIEKSKNGYPEEYQKLFLSKYHSKDSLKYARHDLMSFGWWNCALESMPESDVNDGSDYEREFKKLFIENSCECEQP